MRTALTFLFFLILFSCGNSHSKPVDTQTKIFSHYLYTAFGDNIAQTPCVYVLVPRNSCKGCLQNQLRKVKAAIAPYSSTPCFGIVAQESIPIASLDSICPTKTDTLGLLDRINLPISGITLIRTDNYRVVAFTPIK
jgi:hypothetical protein